MLSYSLYKDLLSLKYQSGSYDCYGLVRVVYNRAYGIVLPNFARPNDFEHSDIGLFAKVTNNPDFLQKTLNPNFLVIGDVLAFRLGADVTNHLGIYLGNNLFLHHMRDRCPVEDTLDERWIKRLTHVMTHQDVKPLKEKLDIKDFIPAHLRSLIQ